MKTVLSQNQYFSYEDNDGDDGNTEKPLACRTGVIFCAFYAKIGESEASARERAGKNNACTLTIAKHSRYLFSCAVIGFSFIGVSGGGMT